jgi:hypothetical protein
LPVAVARGELYVVVAVGVGAATRLPAAEVDAGAGGPPGLEADLQEQHLAAGSVDDEERQRGAVEKYPFGLSWCRCHRPMRRQRASRVVPLHLSRYATVHEGQLDGTGRLRQRHGDSGRAVQSHQAADPPHLGRRLQPIVGVVGCQLDASFSPRVHARADPKQA